jgi:hypothetical protein
VKKNKIDCSLPEIELVPMHPGRDYLKSLSSDPAEPVDEAAYRLEVEREAREFFRHKYINLLPVSDTVDINLTIRISQMAPAENKSVD